MQLPGLRQTIQKGFYKVRIGKEYLNPDALEQGLFYRLKDGMEIHFTPVVAGAKKGGVFQFVAGAVLAVVGYALSWTGVGMVVGNLGVGLMLGGVAQMLTKTPSISNANNDVTKKQSTAFSNIQNMAAQGQPVPLAYGRIRCGSMIISQGVETIDVGE